MTGYTLQNILSNFMQYIYVIWVLQFLSLNCFHDLLWSGIACVRVGPESIPETTRSNEEMNSWMNQNLQILLHRSFVSPLSLFRSNKNLHIKYNVHVARSSSSSYSHLRLCRRQFIRSNHSQSDLVYLTYEIWPRTIQPFTFLWPRTLIPPSRLLFETVWKVLF